MSPVHHISHYPGLNQLLWYYADMEKKRCLEEGRAETLDGLMHGRRGNKERFSVNGMY